MVIVVVIANKDQPIVTVTNVADNYNYVEGDPEGYDNDCDQDNEWPGKQPGMSFFFNSFFAVLIFLNSKSTKTMTTATTTTTTTTTLL